MWPSTGGAWATDLPGAVLIKENDSLSHNYYLQIVLQLGVGLGVHLPSPCWDFVCVELVQISCCTSMLSPPL